MHVHEEHAVHPRQLQDVIARRDGHMYFVSDPNHSRRQRNHQGRLPSTKHKPASKFSVQKTPESETRKHGAQGESERTLVVPMRCGVAIPAPIGQTHNLWRVVARLKRWSIGLVVDLAISSTRRQQSAAEDDHDESTGPPSRRRGCSRSLRETMRLSVAAAQFSVQTGTPLGIPCPRDGVGASAHLGAELGGSRLASADEYAVICSRPLFLDTRIALIVDLNANSFTSRDETRCAPALVHGSPLPRPHPQSALES